jgi:hypothetical protein
MTLFMKNANKMPKNYIYPFFNDMPMENYGKSDKIFAKSNSYFMFVLTVPVLHTIRTADGSFFLYSMPKECIFVNKAV